MEPLEQLGQSGEEALKQTSSLFTQMGEKFLDYLPTLVIGLAVFVLGVLLTRLISHVLSRTMRNSKIDETAKGFGQSLVRILLLTVLVIICLSILGVPMASIITMLGAAGVTVGLALQNSLSNLAGGFVLMFAKPFQAGDYIICGSNEGYVESVTILYTKLRGLDNRSIYLPNSLVSSGAIINISQKGTLRIRAEVSVSYDTNLDTARRVILEALKETKGIRQEPAPSVCVNALGDHGVELVIFCWVHKHDYFTAPPLVQETVCKALGAANITIPFPQIDIHQA